MLDDGMEDIRELRVEEASVDDVRISIARGFGYISQLLTDERHKNNIVNVGINIIESQYLHDDVTQSGAGEVCSNINQFHK